MISMAALIAMNRIVLVNPCSSRRNPNTETVATHHIRPLLDISFLCRFCARRNDSTNTIAILANSAGCTVNPATENERCAPLITSPKNIVNTMSMTVTMAKIIDGMSSRV